MSTRFTRGDMRAAHASMYQECRDALLARGDEPFRRDDIVMALAENAIKDLPSVDPDKDATRRLMVAGGVGVVMQQVLNRERLPDGRKRWQRVATGTYRATVTGE